jgi:hypothetical protein
MCFRNKKTKGRVAFFGFPCTKSPLKRINEVNPSSPTKTPLKNSGVFLLSPSKKEAVSILKFEAVFLFD